MLGMNYRSIGPQNGPTFHEHVAKGFHIFVVEAPFAFVHPSTLTKGNLPSHLNCLALSIT